MRKVSGGVITTAAGNGTMGFSGDGQTAATAQLASPIGVAVDAVGNLYIADSGNGRIRKVSGGVISTIAGGGQEGGDEGKAANARLDSPQVSRLVRTRVCTSPTTPLVASARSRAT